MLVGAAFVPIPPLLVPEIAAGSADADAPLRESCRTVITQLLAARPDEVLVVGPAEEAGQVEGTWDWRGFGVPLPESPPSAKLPHGLAIGAWLLDSYAEATPTRRFHAVTDNASAEGCAELGRALVAGDSRIAMLVCGDGSACRTEKAPGFLDPDATGWDDAALAALGSGEPAALLALDVGVGRRVLAAGRAPWQVLAGAAGDDTFDVRIERADAPYGVMYVVGSWTRPERSG